MIVLGDGGVCFQMDLSCGQTLVRRHRGALAGRGAATDSSHAVLITEDYNIQ